MRKVLISDSSISQGNRDVLRIRKTAAFCSRFPLTFTQGILQRLLIRSQRTYAYENEIDKIAF